MNILFFGITQIAVKGLKKLISLEKLPVGVVVSPTYNQEIENIKQICLEHSIPVYSFESINNHNFISIVKNELKPDLLLTYTFPQKVEKELLSLAKWTINMHPSLLPNYRGANPYFWTIANGENTTGVTYHYLSDRFDEGDIIMQEEVPILAHDTCGMVIAKQEIVAANMLEKLLTQLEKNSVKSTPQPNGSYTKAPRINIKDTFIHWDWTTKKIINRIRALNPYNGALTQYKNLLVAVYEATPTPFFTTRTQDIGATVRLTPEGPMIQCSDGAIIIKICAVGKKYLLSGSDFIEYEKIKIGDKFISW